MIDVIIVNYNTARMTLQTVKCVLKAHNKAKYYLSVIDNGSVETERNELRNGLKLLQSLYSDIRIEYKESPSNLGFAGANNKCIKEKMGDDQTDCFCLLNSDVVVPDDWLDNLLAVDKDIVAPVTNAERNEQTVVVPYTLGKICEDISTVIEYAEKRKKIFDGYYTKTDFVTFFCVLIKKNVFSKIGFLDERFFPGGYEDDDFCIRAINGGFDIAIARDCFIHHFGNSSFSILGEEKRKNSDCRNRARFENKWKRMWESKRWKLLLSCNADLKYLVQAGGGYNGDALYFVTLIISEIEFVNLMEKDLYATIGRYRRRSANIFKYYFDKIRWSRLSK